MLAEGFGRDRALIVDAGVLRAAADVSEPDHEACASLLAGESCPLFTTALVVAQTANPIG